MGNPVCAGVHTQPHRTQAQFARGQQDVFSVGKIAINQAGRAIPVFAMVMAVYLALSLITSVILNWYNRRIQFVER